MTVRNGLNWRSLRHDYTSRETHKVHRIAGTGRPTKSGSPGSIHDNAASCRREIAVEALLDVFVRVEQVLLNLLQRNAERIRYTEYRVMFCGVIQYDSLRYKAVVKGDYDYLLVQEVSGLVVWYL